MNIGAGDGGGIHMHSNEFVLANSTVSGNYSTQWGAGLYHQSGIAGLFNVTVTNNTADSDAGNSDRGGGPTRTHALLAGSPGIDDGNPISCNDWTGTPLTRDQRDSPRPVFGGQSVRCALAAYERQAGLFLPPVRR